jgi:hypothetical protein
MYLLRKKKVLREEIGHSELPLKGTTSKSNITNGVKVLTWVVAIDLHAHKIEPRITLISITPKIGTRKQGSKEKKVKHVQERPHKKGYKK